MTSSKQHLDRAVELLPQIRAVWYERARLDMRMQNYEQARADGEKAASCTQTGGIIDLQVYSLLSHVYTRLGNKELAKRYTDLTRDTPPPVRGENR
jgi:Tfp pilus assembly protein PilF